MRETIQHVLDEKLQNLMFNFVSNPNKNNLINFIKEYKKRLQLYVDGKISTENMADLAINIFVNGDEFFDALKKFDKEALELEIAMDITHPSWANTQRKIYIKSLILLCDELIEKYS